jgi:hypothetical protein
VDIVCLQETKLEIISSCGAKFNMWIVVIWD